MIAVALVSENRLDLASFMPSAKSLTGENHVEKADASPRPSQLANDLMILRDFAGREAESALHVLGAGFLFAGARHDLIEIAEYCGAMPFMRTTLCMRAEIECILFTGSLAQWRDAVNQGCQAHQYSTAREAFNQVYRIFCQKGLSELFSDRRPQDRPDGTFLLLEHK